LFTFTIAVDAMHPITTISNVNLEWLFKLRIVIARCGEMDLARWWNSSKQLTRLRLRPTRYIGTT
jgi:hypothetical protein